MIKIKYQNVVCKLIDDTEYKLLEDSIEDVEADIKRRLGWIIEEKLKTCYTDLLTRYMPLLEADPQISNIPIDKKALAELIFSRPYYKNRKAREKKHGNL